MYINMYVLHHCLILLPRKRREKEGRKEKEGKKKVQPPKNKAHFPIPKRTRVALTVVVLASSRTIKTTLFIEKEKNTERYEKQKAQARAPGALRAGRL
jgi:hypothetical protein